MSLAVVLGSAFDAELAADMSIEPVTVRTAAGDVKLYRVEAGPRPTYLLFRHGRPHRYLPHQIPYRAHALALSKVGCRALVVTSSVGVLRSELPLDRPMLLSDLLMLDNRLPDGRALSIYDEPAPGQGHLVLEEGLFSASLGAQLKEVARSLSLPPMSEVVFGYFGGPRTKTRAENRMLLGLGADVNSMTLAPEIVLANELHIPCAGLVVGHKYSLDGDGPNASRPEIASSLERSKRTLRAILNRWLEVGTAVSFRNYTYRFGGEDRDE